MNFYMLDAAAPGLIYGVMIAFMLVTVVLEGLTMMIMKYNKALKSFIDSLVINLISMGAGFMILFARIDGLDFVENPNLNLVILFVITVLVESAFLYLLNRKIPFKKTLTTAFVINIVSYLFYYCIKFII